MTGAASWMDYFTIYALPLAFFAFGSGWHIFRFSFPA
jgi:hypothetical protein